MPRCRILRPAQRLVWRLVWHPAQRLVWRPSFYLCACLLALFMNLCAAGPGLAAVDKALRPYPYQNCTVFNPYDKGDFTEMVLEALRPFYQELSRHDLVLRHLPGRGGASAWTELNLQELDGYTLALADLPSLALFSLKKYPPFQLDEFTQLCLIGYVPLALWVPVESPLGSLYDLVDQARPRPEAVVLAGSGSGTPQHLASLRLNRQTGVKTAYRPYSGATSSLRGVQQGAAQAFWAFATPDLLVQGCRPLAVAAEQRLPALPQTPTFLELGYDLVENAYLSLIIPSTAPGPSVRNATALHFKLVQSRALQAELARLGLVPLALDSVSVTAYLHQLVEYYKNLKTEYDLP